ncbi:hypothetical protein CABS01_05530 [Colletotrichum abscissum]|uniref:Uncharacterized protein n=1 Tax=Colletotrichum costaricense TaxID=1209916 RepID=A0AAI9Z778_9PEZI|nr:hypothetical protein CSPX01_07213 [Colletotrichum filicis]KAK1521025.1 hypothetical protein CABS01_05530 [Colletotrichum abscissum]KAK1535005.1 hypothetical protein CCOS01_03757 [Colletotrichum costaricense]
MGQPCRACLPSPVFTVHQTSMQP